MQKLQNRLASVQNTNGLAFSSCGLGNHVELLNQITKIQASENMLKKSLENERAKVLELNEQIFELNQRLYESELNDSLDSPKFHKAVHIKIETKKTVDSSPSTKNEDTNNKKKKIEK